MARCFPGTSLKSSPRGPHLQRGPWEVGFWWCCPSEAANQDLPQRQNSFPRGSSTSNQADPICISTFESVATTRKLARTPSPMKVTSDGQVEHHSRKAGVSFFRTAKARAQRCDPRRTRFGSHPQAPLSSGRLPARKPARRGAAAPQNRAVCKWIAVVAPGGSKRVGDLGDASPPKVK